ncbi:galactitol-1-phosphate 5-dehydrogenase [Mammaliicoccus sp. Dog046]|uniref:galactitol-1-phosphate 5-dehydrogenase n=1 Tax=Mammaliicoccus sp. Dog046 TaxID=3034233 RepID=UPI002B25E717|nr:galactitol-1-phosphate 5-dehydrogenase [Mammaliicoccus sp. Dog046]WQK85722.1 galactitol-1-phosphate 5-dehydrogenase [Mammaliicoccus sp. Dog046]
MKALNLYGVEDLRFEETTNPELASPDDVIIKVKATGICGSDTSRYKKLGPYKEGMTFGHEFSGVVEQIGQAVTDLNVGDKVTGCPAVVCHHCQYCEKGEYSRCENLYVIGSYVPGCFAEYVKLPATNVLKLPDNVDLDTAAMVEPSAVVAHGFYRTHMKPGATVAIMGCGSIGLLAIQWAKIFGAAKIIAIDIDHHKLDVATQLGADYTIHSIENNLEEAISDIPDNIDVAVESAGSPFTIGEVLTLPTKGGEVLLLGIPYADIEIHRLHFEKILRNELNVIGSWNGLSAPFPGEEWAATLHYMSTGEINVEPIISDRLSLEAGPETFDNLVNKKKHYDKVIFHP